ncbi:MAG: hypothetical protein ACXW3L_10335 [Limisphaerales bacterium]
MPLTRIQWALLVFAPATVSAADVSIQPSRPPIVRAATNTPHIPPWSVGTPGPRQPATITPGGTFSRPSSTFSSQSGTFSRPSSTFAHPGAPYTPLPPIEVQPVEHGKHKKPHHGYQIITHPHTVIVHQPVVYETQYVEAAPQAAPAETAAVEANVVPPVVLDLPPGAVIRRPALPAESTKVEDRK